VDEFSISMLISLISCPELGGISLTPAELEYLRRQCPYFGEAYLGYMESFRMRPSEQVKLSFTPADDGSEYGDLHMSIKGLWTETIVYEIPLLALTSEAYFKFCSTDWNHDGQEDKACRKTLTLLEHGCYFSEFGSRRRRDYRTQDLVLKGICMGAEQAAEKGFVGKVTGTSNVHFAMKYGIPPVGTVAHEWYMGIAAITNNYENANELGLRYWLGTFGEGVLAIALTDTFGTPAFFEAFKKPIPLTALASRGPAATMASAGSHTITDAIDTLSDIEPPISAKPQSGNSAKKSRTYAEVFNGVRQDSGDPANYVKMTRDFYDSVGIKDKKTIVFSDSLNVELCLAYKHIAEEAGFQPSFGVGTFFTNDFVHKSDGRKSVPLNIVIKISHANGRPAIKISDNIGKNTGDEEVVREVKARLGYVEHDWKNGNEAMRWGQEGGR
jgi:nicotinate phosphoribosyltransferase